MSPRDFFKLFAPRDKKPAYPSCTTCRFSNRFSDTNVAACSKFGWMYQKEARERLCLAEGRGWERILPKSTPCADPAPGAVEQLQALYLAQGWA